MDEKHDTFFQKKMLCGKINNMLLLSAKFCSEIEIDVSLLYTVSKQVAQLSQRDRAAASYG